MQCDFHPGKNVQDTKLQFASSASFQVKYAFG